MGGAYLAGSVLCGGGIPSRVGVVWGGGAYLAGSVLCGGGIPSRVGVVWGGAYLYMYLG